MVARRARASVMVLLVVGAIGLVSLFARPRVATYHTVDILQLVVSGMCFGVALGRLLPGRTD